MKKDKICSIRINSEVKETLESMGMSPQSIVDLYIEKNIEIKTKIKKIKKSK